MSNISDLKFDDKNFNEHTEKGMGLLEKSLQKFGAGRSILIDKNNNIIAGNGVVEAAGNIGLEDMQIVETVGDKIVAVKRTDIDLNTKKGREMAMADNAISQVNLEWNQGTVAAVSDEFGIDTDDWGLDFAKKKSIKDEKDLENNAPSIVTSFITFDYSDEIQLKITDETAAQLMGEMIKYREEHGNYEGFWDERLKNE